jgi:hypothetical protein
MIRVRVFKTSIFVATAVGVSAVVYRPAPGTLSDLPNRIPEAAPYVTEEAGVYPGMPARS